MALGPLVIGTNYQVSPLIACSIAGTNDRVSPFIVYIIAGTNYLFSLLIIVGTNLDLPSGFLYYCRYLSPFEVLVSFALVVLVVLNVYFISRSIGSSNTASRVC